MNSVDKVLRQWLYVGPFDKDVSEQYEDNYRVPVAPYLPFIGEAKEQAAAFRPMEGEAVELFGDTHEWSLLRTDESELRMTWAKFGVHARLLVTYAYCRVHSPAERLASFRLWLAGSAVVLINGVRIHEYLQLGRVETEQELKLPLRQGWNDVLLVLANVHLHCQNSFTLSTEEPELYTELPLLGDGEERQRLERDFQSLQLTSKLISEEEGVALQWAAPLASQGTFRYTVRESSRGVPGRQICGNSWVASNGESGQVPLVNASQLPHAGEYMVRIDYAAGNGLWIKGPSHAFRRVDWRDMPKGALGYGERKAAILGMIASDHHLLPREFIHQELAKMAVSAWDKVDPEAIEEGIAYINARYDCADFALHGLLRMYYLYGEDERLPARVKEAMKQCILNFKYWVDEPGRSMMFTRSENHEILFFSAEYLAGLLFPGEMFPNSGQNGLFHVLKGQIRAERWLKEKGTYGYREWHSNVYYEEDLLALVNLYDFAEQESNVRLLAAQLMEFTIGIMATHSYKGVMATTHGRSYEEMIIHPQLEPISQINWLLFGQPPRLLKKMSIGSIALASSRYAPAPCWEEIAGSSDELYSRSRMGVFVSNGMDGVNCATYKTGDYMVSGMVGSKKGEFGGQIHVGQVFLDGGVPVFVSCFDNKSASTRPSYWGGQYRNPKTIAHRNILAHMYRLGDGPGFTHAYFPFDQFEEWTEAKGWLFGRSRDAYVALYASQPYERVREGEFANRELLCREKTCIWLMEAGNRSAWGSFQRFAEAVSTAEIRLEGERLFYHSPSRGQLILDYDGPCTADEDTIQEEGFPLMENAYMFSEYGSGRVERVEQGKRKPWLNFHI